MDGDDVILPDENIHLAGSGYHSLLIKYREMKHDESMVVVFINFRSLHPVQNVVEVQGMEIEFLPQELNRG